MDPDTSPKAAPASRPVPVTDIDTQASPDIVLVSDVGPLDAIRALLPGIAVLAVADGHVAAERVRVLRPHVVVLGAAASEADAEMILAVRRSRSSMRVIALTAPDEVERRPALLAAGADDALPGPLGVRELAGRVRLLYRPARRPPRSSRLAVGPGLELDIERRELLRDGRRIHLRPKEAQLLEVLTRQRGRVVPRARLVERVWGKGHDGDSRTVDVHARWLRSKIDLDPRTPTRLVTVRGVGYRLETGDA